MKNIRMILSVGILAFLVCGYAASQYAVWQGNAVAYAKQIDSPPVKWLALVFLFLCIVLSFIRDPEANGQ